MKFGKDAQHYRSNTLLTCDRSRSKFKVKLPCWISSNRNISAVVLDIFTKFSNQTYIGLLGVMSAWNRIIFDKIQDGGLTQVCALWVFFLFTSPCFNVRAKCLYWLLRGQGQSSRSKPPYWKFSILQINHRRRRRGAGARATIPSPAGKKNGK